MRPFTRNCFPLLILLCLFSILLVSGCAGTPKQPTNYWKTIDRGFYTSSSEEDAVLRTNWTPCSNYARNTFSHAADSFKKGFPPGTRFYVTSTNDHKRNFFVEVSKVDENNIYGLILSNELIKGKHHKARTKYTLSAEDITDWLIIYPDRPEEGNLIGKYMLLLQDGLASGPCDPQHKEFQHFRLYRAAYSFVPPVGQGWEFKQEYEGSDVYLAQDGPGPHEVNILYVLFFKAPPYESSQALSDSILKNEEKNLGDPDRYTLIKHSATPYNETNAMCGRSHQVINDKSALLSKAGDRGPMTREIQTLTCIQPAKKDVAIVFTYSHRYQEGRRDPEFLEKADRIFKSVAFSYKNLPISK